jgi:hypothetical protein
MFVPPGYLTRAHAGIGVFVVVMVVGLLIVGGGAASDSELQIVGGTAFIAGILTAMALIDRLERQRHRERDAERR